MKPLFIKPGPGARRLGLYLCTILLLPFLAGAQTTVAEWDFNGQAGTPSTSIPANAASAIAVGGGVGSISFTSVGGPNGSYAYASGWANGAGSKHWIVTISTVGYGTLTLSSKQWSEYQFFNSQGPRDFKVQYSTNGTTWTDVPNSAISMTVTNQFMKKDSLVNVALPSACDNQATLSLRWIMTSNTGGNGSDPVSGGQNWIDDISIVGQSQSNTPPTISAIANQVTNEDTPAGPVAFTIGDGQTAASALTVTATSSNTALVPASGIVTGGSGANRSITLTPTADQSGTTTITVTVSDGTLSAAEAFDLQVLPVNDAPVLANIEAGSVNFTEDGPAIGLTSTITVSDIDDAAMESATVAITGGFVASEDLLLFTNTATITGSFSGGVLTLTGTDSKAAYETALRSVQYRNSNSILPNTKPRTVRFTVHDGNIASNALTRTITVTEVNDPPTAVAGPDQTETCVLPSGTLVSFDGSASFDPEKDKLSYSWAVNGNAFAATATAGTTLTPGVYTVTLSVDDGRGGVDRDTLIVTLVPDTTPPTLTVPPDMTFITDPGVCTFTDPGSAIGKASAVDDCPYPVVITSNAPGVYQKGVTLVTWTATDASGNATSASQSITVVDKEAPVIHACPADVTVEGDTQNEGLVPDLTWQLIAADNCTLPVKLAITQNPIDGTVVGSGTHTITFTVTDESGNVSNCTADFTVVPRVEIDPVTPATVISSTCKQPVIVTRSVTINNSGGNFAGGKLAWDASTSAQEITLLNASGVEGEDLVFTVDPRYLTGSTHTRSIMVTGYNSISLAAAINSPYTFTVTIQIEPQGTVTVTRAVGSSWTPFTNSAGHTIAEVKSNAGPIGSFTVSMQPCTLPRVLQRIRYVRRTFALSSSASNPDVDVRLHYTNTEATPLVSEPGSLTIWHRPLNLYVDLGGSSQVFGNYVETTGITDLTGPFVLAHGWNPPVVTVNVTEAEWDDDASSARIRWATDHDLIDPVYVVERRPADRPDGWQIAGSVEAGSLPQVDFTEEMTRGSYVYRILVADASGVLRASQDIHIDASTPAAMSLDQNYPNPFNPSTTITFTLAMAGDVQLTVHDVLGREVARPANGHHAAGTHHVTFDAGALPGGMYSYTLRSGKRTETRRMQLLK
ncbi:MAG: T9SS type A sorting domain-containing protein [Bacteroidota bacterium]|nr:T9SS type A sorting domain-containing protein [Bacteroidota bacterium]